MTTLELSPALNASADVHRLLMQAWALKPEKLALRAQALDELDERLALQTRAARRLREELEHDTLAAGNAGPGEAV